MEYLLKLNEYLDIEDFINDVNEKEEKSRADAEAAKPRSKGRRG
ncbi:hypothetical protein NDO71_orf054 [Klebsiella phage vB_KpnM_NDO71]|jgi:hypothetical protein|uniref:Uncharacterized protein n=1 Tax=Klebsiella phage vB_KpnM_Iguana_ER37 TaxID=3076781 RepID=A0AB38Z381_9CAUD|nr:hypothetical protein NDO71_orf054 [Klebsiella phage vB_KpnM_NDO71]